MQIDAAYFFLFIMFLCTISYFIGYWIGNWRKTLFKPAWQLFIKTYMVKKIHMSFLSKCLTNEEKAWGWAFLKKDINEINDFFKYE